MGFGCWDVRGCSSQLAAKFCTATIVDFEEYSGREGPKQAVQQSLQPRRCIGPEHHSFLITESVQGSCSYLGCPDWRN